MDTQAVPPPDVIRERTGLCRRELAALGKLLRASLALRQADEARRRRAIDLVTGHGEGGDRAS